MPNRANYPVTSCAGTKSWWFIRVNQHLIPHNPHPDYKPIMRKKAGLPGLFAFVNHEHSMYRLSRRQA